MKDMYNIIVYACNVWPWIQGVVGPRVLWHNVNLFTFSIPSFFSFSFPFVSYIAMACVGLWDCFFFFSMVFHFLGLVRFLLKGSMYTQCLLQADRLNMEAKGGLRTTLVTSLLIYMCIMHVRRLNICFSFQTRKSTNNNYY